MHSALWLKSFSGSTVLAGKNHFLRAVNELCLGIDLKLWIFRLDL